MDGAGCGVTGAVHVLWVEVLQMHGFGHSALGSTCGIRGPRVLKVGQWRTREEALGPHGVTCIVSQKLVPELFHCVPEIVPRV